MEWQHDNFILYNQPGHRPSDLLASVPSLRPVFPSFSSTTHEASDGACLMITCVAIHTRHTGRSISFVALLHIFHDEELVGDCIGATVEEEHHYLHL